MPQVVCTRGAQVEAVHPFTAVAVENAGSAEWIGAPLSAAWRSAAKPFQLWCSLEALGDPELPEPLLAIGASSHAGQPEHLQQVRSVQRRFGLRIDQLQCGAHPPLYAGAHADLLRSGQAPGLLHSNCSGKHSFMLAACAAKGWSERYLEPDHPLQRRILEVVEERCQVAPGLAVDGCGVPTFLLPVQAMARAWANIAVSFGGGDPRLARIAGAMMRHPHLTSGTDRLDALVMRGALEPMVVKIGAAALFCMAFPQRKLGIAVKVHSGGDAALGPAVEWALQRLAPGAWRRPDDWSLHRIDNVVGREVGARKVLG